MAENQLKRRRINGTHRWSDAETINLLQRVCEEVKDKPESFEKPTAQIFYKKICATSVVLKTINWVPMKNKMRHLKSLYVAASNWKNQTGAGLLATGDEKSVTQYIEKICPQFNYLEQIFGQRRGVNPVFILETSTKSIDSDTEEYCTDSSPESSTNSQLPDPQSLTSLEGTTDFGVSLKETPKARKKNENPFSLLLSLQQKKLEMEVKKFELEKEMAINEYELKKSKLEQDLIIQKLQLESEERIKKYELELKYKSVE